MSDIKPIYLFADSQLLFWKRDGDLFIKSILKHVNDPEPSAVYIGYSNDNQPEFYDIFTSVMESIGINTCRMLSLDYDDTDKEFLEKASIILLAGGDVLKGWNTIKSKGVNELILKRFSEGVVLMGVSAGAVQLGMSAGENLEDQKVKAIDMLQILPFVIGAHQESNEWQNLRQLVEHKGQYTKGLGLPFGSGLIYHSDHTVEPLKNNIVEVAMDNEKSKLNFLYPEVDKNKDNELLLQ